MRAGIGLFVALSLLAACARAPEPVASEAWVRLPAIAERPGAAFFTVKGGDHDTSLVAVTSPIALRTELHETMAMSGHGDHGMMTMAPIKDVPVKAGDTLSFAPGGKHVMLFDVSPAVKPGQSVPLTLSFADGKSVTVQAKTVPAGAPKP